MGAFSGRDAIMLNPPTLRLEPLGERLLLSTLPINPPVLVSPLSADRARLEMIQETASASAQRVILLHHEIRTWAVEAIGIPGGLEGAVNLFRHEIRAWLEQVFQGLEAHDPASPAREADGPIHEEAASALPRDDDLVFVAGLGADGTGMGRYLLLSRDEGFPGQSSREGSDEFFGADLGSETNPLARPGWKLPDPWAELAPLDSASGALVPAFTVRERPPEGTPTNGREDSGLNRFVIGLGEPSDPGGARAPAISPAARLFEDRVVTIGENVPPPCETLVGDEVGESEEAGGE
jgi:hypothetical protein